MTQQNPLQDLGLSRPAQRRTGLFRHATAATLASAGLFRHATAATLASASLAVLLLSGCHRAPGADVMATVNGKPILRAEVEKYYKNKVGNSPQPSQIQADSLKLNILRQLIDDEIMQQRAAKLKLVATDDEVDAKLNEYKAPYTQEQFDARLKEQGITLDDFKRDIRRQLTNEKLLNKEINSKINVTDTDITDYYNQHKSDYNLVESAYHLAQIVVTPTPGTAGNLQNSKATNEADALKKVQDLHNRLESGEDFGTLAANFSEDGLSQLLRTAYIEMLHDEARVQNYFAEQVLNQTH
jgi:peptidyl-prolyl cis-trans isomerase SurA